MDRLSFSAAVVDMIINISYPNIVTNYSMLLSINYKMQELLLAQLPQRSMA